MCDDAPRKCANANHTQTHEVHIVLSFVSSYAGHGHSRRRRRRLLVVVVVSNLHCCCCCCALNQERVGGGDGDDTYVMCNSMFILCHLW